MSVERSEAKSFGSLFIGTYYLLKNKNVEERDGKITLIYYQNEDSFLLFSLKAQPVICLCRSIAKIFTKNALKSKYSTILFKRFPHKKCIRKSVCLVWFLSTWHISYVKYSINNHPACIWFSLYIVVLYYFSTEKAPSMFCGRGFYSLSKYIYACWKLTKGKANPYLSCCHNSTNNENEWTATGLFQRKGAEQN